MFDRDLLMELITVAVSRSWCRVAASYVTVILGNLWCLSELLIIIIISISQTGPCFVYLKEVCLVILNRRMTSCVPISRLPDLVHDAQRLIAESGFIAPLIGHAGEDKKIKCSFRQKCGI
jgi:hypothetical protein